MFGWNARQPLAACNGSVGELAAVDIQADQITPAGRGDSDTALIGHDFGGNTDLHNVYVLR